MCLSERSMSGDKLMGKARQDADTTQGVYVAPMIEQHVGQPTIRRFSLNWNAEGN